MLRCRMVRLGGRLGQFMFLIFKRLLSSQVHVLLRLVFHSYRWILKVFILQELFYLKAVCFMVPNQGLIERILVPKCRAVPRTLRINLISYGNLFKFGKIESFTLCCNKGLIGFFPKSHITFQICL